MFLKKNKAATPEAPRSKLEQTAAIGVSPGQKILGLMTAIIGSVVILGAVAYKYILPVWRGEQPQTAAANSNAQATSPPPAPKLSVPLDLGATPEAPPLSTGLFGSAPGMAQSGPSGSPATMQAGTKPCPPGMIGCNTSTGQPPLQQADAQNPDSGIEAARQRKMQGDLGNFEGNKKAAEEGTGAAAPAPAQGQARPASSGAASLQASGAGTTALSSLLIPTATPTSYATYIQNQHLTLAKGTSLTCNLDTAIQTDQFGFVSCLTDYPVYSMDGKVILAERGTKIDGEYGRGLDRGMRAIFVLWTTARTPTGVIIPLASPATDPLGRAGIHGEVDNKFWDRFGGALMFSIIQDSLAISVARAEDKSGGGSVVVTPNTQNTGQDAVGEILKQAGDVKPTLSKNHGETVAITVARNIDFSNVYRLTAKAQ